MSWVHNRNCVYSLSYKHFRCDIMWKQCLFHVCVLCIQQITHKLVDEYTGSAKTCLQHRHHTKSSFFHVCIFCLQLIVNMLAHRNMLAKLGHRHETRIAFTWCHYQSASLTEIIPEFSKPLTSATFALDRVFYCVARTWVMIGCQRELLLLGRLLWMNLRRTQCKLRLSTKDALVKGLQNLATV